MHRHVHRRNESIEFLESRMMLSAAVAHVTDGLTHTQLLGLYATGMSEVQGKHDALGIASTNLRQLYSLNPTGVGISSQQFGTIESSDGDPAVAVHTHGSVTVLLGSLEKLGLSVMAVNSSSHMVDGYLPISSLVLAAKLTGVTSITAISKTTVNSVGSAVDQADSVENVTAASDAYGVDGTGVKIGVISDSVNRFDGGIAASVASGDLANNITVLKDGMPGDTDEGRAMMEELHDLAPGAQLYFYSGDGAQDAMVTAINALKAAGCNIIVDDLGYTDEPMFQDGVISKAINTFVAGGGSYFSAIGNDGNSGYLHTNTQYTTTNGATWVNWADNGAASGETLSFNTDGPVDITLQWDNPYNGDTGSATADLDVFIYQGSTLIASSTDDNIATGIPEETLNTLPAGTYQMKVQLAALSPGAVPPDMIKFVAAEDANGGLTGVQYTNSTGLRSSGYGHGAGQNTISVGAVEFASAPPFSSKTPIPSESYSSTGPIIYAFDPNGNRLTTPLTLDKPDVSGVDGVNTSFFGDVTADDPTTLPQFYGTSAAAPNVAAIAALIDQEHPGATQAQILSALIASATPLNGAAAGTWDPQGGYGLVNAETALADFNSSAGVTPTVTLSPVTTPRTTTVSSETITFNEPVVGFTLADLSLTRNGGANLLTGAQTLTTTDQTTFTLSNLAGLTSTAGTYKLTLGTSGIEGDGLPLANGASVTWVKNTAVAPTVTLSPIISPRTSAVANETITFSEAVTGMALSNLSLTLNGGANLLTGAQTLTSPDQTTFSLNNLSSLTQAAGTYTLTLSPTGITGSGLPLAAGATVTWQVTGSNAPPTVTLAPVNTPRTTPLNSETITFNEPVTGLTVANFSLSQSLGGDVITSNQTLTTSNNITYTLGNLAPVTSIAASYVLTMSPNGVVGSGGNLNNGAAISWQMTATIPTAPIAVLGAITSPTMNPVSSEGITFNEPVTGFSLASLSLTLNGGANLLTSAQTLTSSDQTTFTLGNLAGITTAPGNYVLTLSPTGITGTGVAMAAGTSVSWTVTPPPAPPTVTLASITTPTATPVASENIVFSEPITGLTLADLTLTRNGGANLLTGAQTLTTTDQTTFTLNNLSALTSVAGTYVLTLGTAGITGSGFPLAAGASVTWVQSTTVATASVSVGNATVTKPSSGTIPMNFTVTLSAASTSPITVDYRTVAGTASSAAGDYIGIASGVLTIPAGQTTGTITVTVKGNALKNLPKTFSVDLTGATGATIGTAIGTGTILSSSTTTPSITFPTISAIVASTTQDTVLSIPVVLTSAATSNVTITYGTVAGTASSGGGDYLGIPAGTLTILAGQTTGHITITVKPHPANTNKFFFVDLTGATNATLVNKIDKVTLT